MGGIRRSTGTRGRGCTWLTGGGAYEPPPEAAMGGNEALGSAWVANSGDPPYATAPVPDFGAAGGATQYMTDQSVQWLLENKFSEILK